MHRGYTEQPVPAGTGIIIHEKHEVKHRVMKYGKRHLHALGVARQNPLDSVFKSSLEACRRFPEGPKPSLVSPGRSCV